MKNTNSGITSQNNATFPFSNFDFSNFETFNSFTSAKTKFLADNFFGDDAKIFEFAFFSPFNFSDFANFFAEDVAPKLQKGSFVKFNFFFDKDFNFAEFNEFSNQFSKEQEGIFIEFSFFRTPSESFNFDGFNFSEFGFPLNFNGDFMFSVSQRTEGIRWWILMTGKRKRKPIPEWL